MTKSKLNLSTFIASFFGLGFIPFAPGTFGSIGAFAIYWLIPGYLFESQSTLYYLGALVLFSLLAVWISTRAEKTLGHDAPSIVIDEVAGYLLSVAFLPKGLLIGIYALVLFRVFDIAKPYPIKGSQKLKAGWGIVVDDLLAGLYTAVLLQIINIIYPKFFGI